MGEAMTESQQNLEGGGAKGGVEGSHRVVSSQVWIQEPLNSTDTSLQHYSLPCPFPFLFLLLIISTPFPSLPFPRLLVSPGLAAMTSCTVKLP